MKDLAREPSDASPVDVDVFGHDRERKRSRGISHLAQITLHDCVTFNFRSSVHLVTIQSFSELSSPSQS